MSDTRIVASVDPETKSILEETAKAQKISISALLRQVALRIRDGKFLI